MRKLTVLFFLFFGLNLANFQPKFTLLVMAYPRRIEPAVLLDVTLQIVDEKGFAGLSMRELASRLGVKAASLYRHMASLDDLKFQMAERAARQLGEQLKLSRDRLPDGSPPARLAAMAWAYVLWAEQFPGRYDVLAAVSNAGPEMQGLRTQIAGVVRPLIGVDGVSDDEHLWQATHAMLAFLHGHVMLGRCGLGATPAGPDGFERGLVAMLRGL